MAFKPNNNPPLAKRPMLASTLPIGGSGFEMLGRGKSSRKRLASTRLETITHASPWAGGLQHTTTTITICLGSHQCRSVHTLSASSAWARPLWPRSCMAGRNLFLPSHRGLHHLEPETRHNGSYMACAQVAGSLQGVRRQIGPLLAQRRCILRMPATLHRVRFGQPTSQKCLCATHTQLVTQEGHRAGL